MGTDDIPIKGYFQPTYGYSQIIPLSGMAIKKRGKAAAPSGAMRSVFGENFRRSLECAFPDDYQKSPSAAMKKLADRMETSFSQVQRLASGTENPKLDTMEHAARSLGVSIIDLLTAPPELRRLMGVGAVKGHDEEKKHLAVHDTRAPYSRHVRGKA